jgi:hypothetical protein
MCDLTCGDAAQLFACFPSAFSSLNRRSRAKFKTF